MKKIIALVYALSLFISTGICQDVPTLEWAKVFTGTFSEIPNSIVTDLSGNVYTTGTFNGTSDFDPGAGVFTLTSAADSPDIFISKIDINGNFVWAKSMGGTDTDNGFAIAVDAVGNVYTTGLFNNTVDFDPGTGTFNITSLGSAEIFVSKLDTDGNFVWAKSAGGTGYQQANAIALDASGNVYTTGYFFGATDFDPSASAFTITPLAAEDVFILKLDSNGDFVWAKSFEGASTERGKSIAVDASGNVYTTGFIFNGTMDLDPGVGVLSITTASFRSMFISKLDLAGNFVWGKAIAELTSVIESESIVLDNSGNILITGSFSGIADFDTGAGVFNLTADSGTSFADIFIVKLDTNGDLVWAKSIGPNSNYQIGTSIIADALGKVYITGRFAGITDFDPGVGIFNLASAGGADVFVSCLDVNGNFLWAIRIGGSGTSGDTGTSINIDALGNVHVAGSFFSPIVDFDFGPCVLNISNTGFGDGFIEKINIGVAIPPPTITSFTPPSGSIGTTVTVTGTNFKTTPGNNIVSFNGTTSVVTVSTATSITTTVPTGATTGKISVTVNCLTATSATDFTIGTPQNFITQWNLATAGSGANQVSFGTATSGVVNYTWQQLPSGASGSGSWSGATLTITGLPAGATIRLQITPTNFQRIIINTGTDRNRLTRVEQWGTTVWSSMQNAFRGCANLQVTAADLPDLSGLSDLSGMFSLCTTLNSPSNIGSWNTSVVTNMSALFSQASAFNQNISSWNTGAVTNMSSLFADAAAFNQDIGIWNTSSVTNMAAMFAGALVFNRTIGAWNTAAVTNMNSMFFSAYVFNQNISGWNTAAVTNMASMFGYARDFNQNIGTWNTLAVTNMSRMFEDAFDFNQNIGTWNTSAVTNMRGMFIDAYAFNQNIGTWNTSAVTDMSRMFDFATAFNQNIGAWNTASVTNMSGMFADASAFNQNIGTWSLNPGVNLTGMLNNSNMDCNNYSATLIGWSANASTPNGRTLGANGRQYGTNAVAARTNLDITKSWTITGDTPSGADCIIITITINTQPVNFSACFGQAPIAIFTTNATGPANITYQWERQLVDFTFDDVVDGGAYSGANTSTLTVNTGVGPVSLAYRCRINGDFAIQQTSTTASLLAIFPPSAPTTTSANRCGAGGVTLTASGGTSGQYRWYAASTGGTSISGEVNSSYTTPSLTTTTTYFVAINNGTCESTRTPVTATINATPAKPTIISSITPTGNNVSFCSSNVLTLSAPAGFNTYTWSPGGSTQQITASTGGSYSVTVTDVTGCSSVASDVLTVTVIPAPCSNQPPVIASTSGETQIEGKVSLDLLSLISDADSNIDIQSLKIKTQPTSGAKASITVSGRLELDYQGISFSGPDVLTIEVCDLLGDCTQQVIKIEVIGDLTIYNGISPNGDGLNDIWIIEYLDVLEETKNNKVSVYNRWGDVVWETENYDNQERVFKGLNKNGNEVSSGTYFYKIEFSSGRKAETGYLALKR
jgi:gliding motility-associated-like protein